MEELRFGAEYDGVRWHGPEEAEHDGKRRGILEQELLWTLRVFRRENVYGPTPDAGIGLQDGIREARLRHGQFRPES